MMKQSKRDDRIVLVSAEGARDIVRCPLVFEGTKYPERIVIVERPYAYVGTQEGTPVYRAESGLTDAERAHAQSIEHRAQEWLDKKRDTSGGD